MTVNEVMTELEALGSEQTRKVLRKHGATDPFFGVKIGDMKNLRKALKGNQEIAFELYDTGNSDAMYLAGLIADETKMTKTQFNQWVKKAPWSLIANTTVAALAAESPHAIALAKKWIDAKKELVASAGWCTLSHHLSLVGDEVSDPDWIGSLVPRVVAEIHDERNEVKASMNGFLIALGCFCPSFTKAVRKAAKTIGAVEVDQGKTACKTPDISAYIDKVEKAGRMGKTKKMARC
jgi:3-methyladenine DNA glycosylase AlkD